jgi:hypothetical protein
MSAVAEHHQRCKAVHAEVIAVGFDPRNLFVVLINTAQFEFLLKEVREREIERGGGERERERMRVRERVVR